MINRRTILKAIALLPFFAFLKPAKALTDRQLLAKLPKFKIRKYPETCDELIDLLELEYPVKISFKYGGQLPVNISKIKYENPRQGALTHTPYIEKEWIGKARIKEGGKRKLIRELYKKIIEITRKTGSISVNWRIEPEIVIRYDFTMEKKDPNAKVFELYARVIFI